MVRLLVAILGALGSFYLLLPVVPSYTAATGAGGIGASLPTGMLDGSPDADGLAGPSVVFAAVTLVAGVLLTFLPLSLSPASHRLAAVALLVLSFTAPLARWTTGRYGGSLLFPHSHHGRSRGRRAGLGTQPLSVIVGAGLFGIGFDVAQNVTLALMFARVPGSRFARVSALWNFAYDGGDGHRGRRLRPPDRLDRIPGGIRAHRRRTDHLPRNRVARAARRHLHRPWHER
jgi:hypothetical protein